MKKTKKNSNISEQQNLIEPPMVIDLRALLNESKLSKNEIGLIKRRLLESQEPFGKFLQQLVRCVEQEQRSLDIPQSLKKLEEDETRYIRSFDSVAKILSRDFPELLQFILDEYQVEAEQTRVLVGKEFIAIKRIADVIFSAQDKNGNEVIIHLEFEYKYRSDEEMDKRKLEYRHLMEMDEDYEGKTVLCNVFYLRGSPKDKNVIEERAVKWPTSDPRYSGELKYKAYHLSLMTIEMIIERNLPFLIPFVVESELRAIDKETAISQPHISSVRQQLAQHETELSQMIHRLTADQRDSLRTIIEYLSGKSYSNSIFNNSTLVKLMIERIDSRQEDIRWGRTEGITEGIAKARTERRAKEISVAQQMVIDGELTREQMEKFLKRMDDDDKK